jgi:beta propeller repeat protein
VGKKVFLTAIACCVFLITLSGGASAVTVTTLPLSGKPMNLNISGHRVSYMDFISLPDFTHVHVYDFSTTPGVDTDITPVDSGRFNPSINGNLVVWHEEGATGVYQYDIAAPIIGGAAIPGSGTIAYNPVRDGSILAWGEYNPGLTSDIWYKDGGGAAVQVTNVPNNHFADFPDVSGRYIVWQLFDNTGLTNFDVYYYDFDNPIADGTAIASGPSIQEDPRISGANVVYSDNADGDFEIYLYPLPGGPAQKITDNVATDVSPDISGNYIVWSGDGQIFLYDINTAQTTQISDGLGPYVEPRIDGNHVVWLNTPETGPATAYLATIQEEVTLQLPYTGR